MKAVEFAYWLQGYFEISGGKDAVLTPAQATQILAKIDKVEQGDSKVEKDAMAFINTTSKFLGSATPDFGLDATTVAAVLKQATPKIQSALNTLFIHAIDQSYEGDQNLLNNHHNGGGNGPVMRC